MRTSWWPLLIGAAAFALRPATARAQSAPSGPEFRVNTVTTSDETSPDVAVDPTDGRFLVTWGSSGKCLAQRYDASGIPLGGQFQADGVCSTPGSTAAPPGTFVVFGAANNSGTTGSVYGFGFDTTTGVQKVSFQSSYYTAGVKKDVRVRSSPNGSFVVVWSGAVQDGSGYGVFAQRYTPSFNSLDDEFRVNTTTTNDQTVPAVALDGSGNFVIVWQSVAAGGLTQILGQRYASSGALLGGEFRVNTYLGPPNYDPDVASDAGGNFVVVWRDVPYGYSSEVLARRYASDGSPIGDPFLVNGSTAVGAFRPRVTRRSGDFVVVWQEHSDSAGLAALGRRFAPDGSALGGIFRVNTYTTGDQALPVISSKPDGGFVVVWESKGQDGNGYGIYAQKYCLGGDADGNGTVDVADVFYLINYLFAGGPPPHGCADANGNFALDVADVFYLINYLFAGGPAPV